MRVLDRLRTDRSLMTDEQASQTDEIAVRTSGLLLIWFQASNIAQPAEGWAEIQKVQGLNIEVGHLVMGSDLIYLALLWA